MSSKSNNIFCMGEMFMHYIKSWGLSLMAALGLSQPVVVQSPTEQSIATQSSTQQPITTKQPTTHYMKSWASSFMAALGLSKPVVIQQQAAQKPIVIGTTHVIIVRGDILQQKVDAIVNAANEDLSHGGGVALAISKAAGPQLQKYSDAMPVLRNGKRCPTGSAVITPAFDLEKRGIKKIVHATGPTGTMPNKEQLLRSAYQNSLQVALDNTLRSIAFPSISTAIFGYDINQATPVAFKAVRDFIKEHPGAFDEIRFVVFSDPSLAVYKKYENVLRA
jgi:O-acetyl-ADP-ribose deacetylase (regulator of RNase III)